MAEVLHDHVKCVDVQRLLSELHGGGMGGLKVLLCGRADGIKRKPSTDPYTVNPATTSIAYFGGKQWVRLLDDVGVELVRAGSTVVVELEVQQGREGVFFRGGRLLAVDGKGVKRA